jgi:hypothetical protein
MIIAKSGSIIEGSLRSDHLLSAFLFALEELKHPKSHAINQELISYGFGYSQCGVCGLNRDQWPEGFGDDEAEDIIADLMEALDECSPENHYFGSHQGDGSDFGFWELEEEP